MTEFKKLIASIGVVALIIVATPAMVMAKAAPQSFADLVEKLSPAVVNVYTKENIPVGGSRGSRGLPPEVEEFFKRFGPRGQTPEKDGDEKPRTRQRSSLGSGFIISADGIIVTNNHVIDKADEVSVKLSDGTELDAEIVGRDKQIDIAVLRVKSKKPLPFVKFGNDEEARVGDWVMAIGNPYGLGGSVTAGIISARNRDINSGPYDDYIQTDASINRGNSGGPMFNMDGEVIGINTVIISPSGGNVGIGFAVPTSLAQPIVKQIIEFGQAKRGWLGVRIQAVTEEIAESLGLDEKTGALVSSVSPDSPAEEGKIQSGDIILTFDGKKVKEMRELPRIVADTPIGKRVKVVVWRKGNKKTLRVKIAELEQEVDLSEEMPKDEDPETEEELKKILGMSLENLTDKTRKSLKLNDDFNGVLVSSVERYSAAAEKGLRRGDVIVEVTQEPVTTVDEAIERIESLQAKGRKSVLLKIYRRGDYTHVPVPFEDKEDE